MTCGCRLNIFFRILRQHLCWVMLVPFCFSSEYLRGKENPDPIFTKFSFSLKLVMFDIFINSHNCYNLMEFVQIRQYCSDKLVLCSACLYLQQQEYNEDLSILKLFLFYTKFMNFQGTSPGSLFIYLFNGLFDKLNLFAQAAYTPETQKIQIFFA